MPGGLGQFGGSALKQRTLHAPCTEHRAPTGLPSAPANPLGRRFQGHGGARRILRGKQPCGGGVRSGQGPS